MSCTSPELHWVGGGGGRVEGGELAWNPGLRVGLGDGAILHAPSQGAVQVHWRQS